MEYIFTRDYTTMHTKVWTTILKDFIGKPGIKFLEIGSLEGRSTVWFLENILTHVSSNITCIDYSFNENFAHNIAPFIEKVKPIRLTSYIALRQDQFLLPSFDIIYVDGSHTAPDVLHDAILSFKSLKTGGIMIFDDYGWEEPRFVVDQDGDFAVKARQEPKMAIDAFINIFFDSLEVIHRDWQVIIRKKGDKKFSYS